MRYGQHNQDSDILRKQMIKEVNQHKEQLLAHQHQLLKEFNMIKLEHSQRMRNKEQILQAKQAEYELLKKKVNEYVQKVINENKQFILSREQELIQVKKLLNQAERNSNLQQDDEIYNNRNNKADQQIQNPESSVSYVPDQSEARFQLGQMQFSQMPELLRSYYVQAPTSLKPASDQIPPCYQDNGSIAMVDQSESVINNTLVEICQSLEFKKDLNSEPAEVQVIEEESDDNNNDNEMTGLDNSNIQNDSNNNSVSHATINESVLNEALQEPLHQLLKVPDQVSFDQSLLDQIIQDDWKDFKEYSASKSQIINILKSIEDNPEKFFFFLTQKKLNHGIYLEFADEKEKFLLISTSKFMKSSENMEFEDGIKLAYELVNNNNSENDNMYLYID